LGSLDTRRTDKPPAGAWPVSASVAWLRLPLSSAAGLRVNVSTTGGCTVRFTARLSDRVPVVSTTRIEALIADVTGWVVTSNAALVPPDGTLTLAGVLMVPVGSPSTKTWIVVPAAGAGPVSVIVTRAVALYARNFPWWDQWGLVPFMAEVTGVNTEKRYVIANSSDRSQIHVPYDYLILATGQRHSYFGHDEFERFAPGLKSLADAVAIRNRVLQAFEQAEAEEDTTKHADLLTFVLVGAGPTGAEMAAALAVMVRTTLYSEFRRIDPLSARIVLVDMANRVLGTFAEDLSEAAKKHLEEALAIYMKAFPEGNHTTAVTLNNLGLAIDKDGNLMMDATARTW
jgi:hypothetical protein